MEVINSTTTATLLDISKNEGNYLTLSPSIKVDTFSEKANTINKWLREDVFHTQILSNAAAKTFIKEINNSISNTHYHLKLQKDKSNLLLKITQNIYLHIECFQGEIKKPLNIWLEGIIINQQTSKKDYKTLVNWITKTIKKCKETEFFLKQY
ncbi:TPA: hypothetical protein QCQ70_003265 [Bacillus cytotoxicus]|nr:hypothetical protein [Bacillus cytotoxicus]